MEDKNTETVKNHILPYDLPAKPVSHYWYLEEQSKKASQESKNVKLWDWFDQEHRERQRLLIKILFRHNSILTRGEQWELNLRYFTVLGAAAMSVLSFIAGFTMYGFGGRLSAEK